MSWAKLLADNRVTALPPSKVELDNLRSIVARSLKDVEAAGLSADAHAARTLSLLVVRATGYRPRTVGAHYNTFLALETADPGVFCLSPQKGIAGKKPPGSGCRTTWEFCNASQHDGGVPGRRSQIIGAKESSYAATFAADRQQAKRA